MDKKKDTIVLENKGFWPEMRAETLFILNIICCPYILITFKFHFCVLANVTVIFFKEKLNSHNQKKILLHRNFAIKYFIFF